MIQPQRQARRALPRDRRPRGPLPSALRWLAAVAVAVAFGGCGLDLSNVARIAPGRAAARLDVAGIAQRLGDRFTQVRQERIPVRKLRGYGELAADFVLFEAKAGGQASLLGIQCEDEAKAGIVHAKYLSDLHLLLPVKDETVNVAGLTFPVVGVPDQGVIAAFRKRALVTIAAATDAADLTAVLAALSGACAGAELAPSGRVPLYLDAWDRHGFRFYYRRFADALGPRGSDWDGSLQDIAYLRCDGLVELAYEYNAVMVWGRKVGGAARYDIQYYQDDHNDFKLPCNPERLGDSMWSALFSVTQGGFADAYLAEKNPVVSGPTVSGYTRWSQSPLWRKFRGTYWDSRFEEQRLVYPRSPESHRH